MPSQPNTPIKPLVWLPCLAAVTLALTVFDAAAAEAPPDGRQVFKDHCSLCHSVRKLTPELCEKLPAQRRDFLERYLASHHAPDPAERKAVRDYLELCCD